MIANWKPNPSAPLWYSERHGEPHGPFFGDLTIEHVKQVGPSCVATTLSMVANATGANTTPEDFKAVTNSQAPHTWSEALKPYGMQLAYCNNDVRRLEHFVDELVTYDDLFFLCFYSVDPPSDPQPSGKLCTAHIITLHGDTIYDTAKWPSSGGVCNAHDYSRLERQTKRIFRVVPLYHPRCI
mgnify:FL=1|tara:strand:+ start:544 stop:1092 length:549 start_codon:yes stop_codon:yes gene_type:complete